MTNSESEIGVLHEITRMREVAVRESPIGGLGVFTVESLRAGETIRELDLVREITPDAPLRPEQGELPEHCPIFDGRFYLLGSPDRHFNHSCDPNTCLRFAADRIEVVARRDIAAGDELTLDYLINNPGGDSWPCHCGASRCRGEMAPSFFDLPEELQREYLPLLAPWFVRRHSRIVPFEPRFGETCERLIAALPDWFGLPESNAAYLHNLSLLPSWVALLGSQPVGAITLEPHFPGSFEVHFMAVHPAHHRCGIGRALLQHLESEARARGGRWLQVKTLAPSHPDPFYARTRRFYEAMGFQPLFESATLWGPENPALVSLKAL